MEVTIGKKADSMRRGETKLELYDIKETQIGCPIRDVLTRVTNKWSIYVITKLGTQGIMRFSELKNGIKGISQRMLTVTLRHLEEDGLISRTIFPEIPPRVEYELTATGLGLLQQLISLSKWAQDNMEGIIQSRENHC